LVLARERTKICFLEFTAIPETSPKYVPAGSLKKFGVDSKGISGIVDCEFATVESNIAEQAHSDAVFISVPLSRPNGRRTSLRYAQMSPNTPRPFHGAARYGSGAIAFHWTMFALVVGVGGSAPAKVSRSPVE
jgi:hypothetical protein